MSALKFCSVVATAGALLALPALANATTIFSDDFDSESNTSELNFFGFDNWDVSDGTVDYIRSGDHSIVCNGGSGGCVDLDGSTFDAGILSSPLHFAAGADYDLSFWYSGNQRPEFASGDDTLYFGVMNGSGDVLFGDTIFGIDANVPFTLAGLNFSPLEAFDGRLFFRVSGTDNIGAILDDVALRVPEPGSLGLLGIGLITLVLSRRRAR